MNHFKIYALAFAGCAVVACDDVDEMFPEGGALSGDQISESVAQAPERGQATFEGMFSMMGQPYYVDGENKQRADDFGFVMMAISNDAEGADMVYPNSGYNWFAPCGELSTRDVSYSNPRLRYTMPYAHMGVANELIRTYSGATEGEALNVLAQAHAVRAFDYLSLAPYYQFDYESSKDLPCVPKVTEEDVDFTNNPRASVAEIYELIISDLTFAVDNLTSERSDKAKINKNVALGLRARAYLNMGMFAEAAADAEAAMEGFEPASIEEVSKPAFCSLDEHNWMWGVVVTLAQAQDGLMATCASWVSPFSATSYTAGTGCYPAIFSALFDKIPSTDVRKGWWLDENMHSDNIKDCVWDGVVGDAIAPLVITDVKLPMYEYANVKFGLKSGIGTSYNDNDWPLMRVEEMILIAAEGYAKSGNEAKAKEILTNFVTTYRDPEYTIPSSRSLADEIWFQRRVELWGEGFFSADRARLKKNLVRSVSGKVSNWPDAFLFNVKPDDPWLLMRFVLSETNTNLAIVNNVGGIQPIPGQNPELLDGVTD